MEAPAIIKSIFGTPSKLDEDTVGEGLICELTKDKILTDAPQFNLLTSSNNKQKRKN